MHHEVRVSRNLKTRKTDKLGNIVYEREDFIIEVAGWYSPSSDEFMTRLDERHQVDIILFAKTGDIQKDDLVTLPNFPKSFRVDGVPRNYDYGPFGWSPGYEVVSLVYVE